MPIRGRHRLRRPVRSRGTVAGVLWLLAAAPGRAQVSPGELSAAHADLEGIRNCVACHDVQAGSMESRCLACHEGVAWTIEQGRGFHAHLEEGKTCARCHPEHAGREFELIAWEEGDPERFDHERAGWPLEGAHATAKCRACHKPEFQVSPAFHRLRRKDPRLSWIGLERECLACHADPHEGRFGTRCTDCHDQRDWHAIDEKRFDHDRTRYPLRGRHARLECASCHDPAKAWGKRPPFARCSDCHADPHAGAATLAGRPADCNACHTVDGFDRPVFTVERHRRTRFPLEGAHAKVACSKCHPKNPPGASLAALGEAGVLLRPRFDACTRCHEKAHGEQLAHRADGGRCDACHTPAGWKPSTFTAADHARTPFPLEGAHAEARCAACHGPERPGLPAPRKGPALGPAGVIFAAARDGCAGCHADPHEGRYAPGGAREDLGGCRNCHGSNRFRPAAVGVERHAKFGFPLEGAHRATPCSLCHEDLRERPKPTSTLKLAAHLPPLRFESGKKSCRDCHRSPHGRQFDARPDGGRCDACHGVGAFKPAERFDHDRDSSYPLIGAHARAACAKCHPAVRGPDGRPMIRYRPIPTACSHCHGTAALAPLAAGRGPSRGGRNGTRSQHPEGGRWDERIGAGTQ